MQFWLALAIVAAVGLVLRIEVGRRTYINFDEWQHLFMASGARWSDVWFELKANAHPPLFFVLLRGIALHGDDSHFRLISIVSGVGSIVVVGLVARKVLRSPAMQLAAAAVLAVSANAIVMSTEIRSYQLAAVLSGIAFLAWLEMFPGPDGEIAAAPCAVFAIFSSLALLSHYGSIFVLVASLTVPILLAALYPGARRRWLASTKGRSLLVAGAATAVPCVVFAIEYLLHAGSQPEQGYLREYLFGGMPSETILGFVIRSSRSFLNLVLPFEIGGSGMAVALIAALVAVTVQALVGEADDASKGRVKPAATVLFAAVVVVAMLLAALARKYPFGGLLRHQYIAASFLLCAGMVILDRLAARAKVGRLVPATIAVGAAVSLTMQWPALAVYPGHILLSREYSAWRASSPDARAVYVEHWGVIGFYIHTHQFRRRYVRSIDDAARIDQYHVTSGSAEGLELFYDKSRDHLDFSDPTLYRSIAACLRDGGVPRICLFYFSPGHRPFAQAPHELTALIERTSGEQGLVAADLKVSPTTIFGEFRLR